MRAMHRYLRAARLNSLRSPVVSSSTWITSKLNVEALPIRYAPALRSYNAGSVALRIYSLSLDRLITME